MFHHLLECEKKNMAQQTRTPEETPPKKRAFLSHRMRVALALFIIALAVILTLFFAPHERDSGNVTGDSLPVTVTVTNQVASLNVNHSAVYNTVHFTVTQVTEAKSFSDDLKRGGNYVVRVEMMVQGDANQQAPVGLNYPALVRLQLANGQSIAPKLVNLSPDVLPSKAINGYIDFALSAPIPDLSGMSLQIGSGTTIPFGG
jgi:hypothetical protein